MSWKMLKRSIELRGKAELLITLHGFVTTSYTHLTHCYYKNIDLRSFKRKGKDENYWPAVPWQASKHALPPSMGMIRSNSYVELGVVSIFMKSQDRKAVDPECCGTPYGTFILCNEKLWILLFFGLVSCYLAIFPGHQTAPEEGLIFVIPYQAFLHFLFFLSKGFVIHWC